MTKKEKKIMTKIGKFIEREMEKDLENWEFIRNFASPDKVESMWKNKKTNEVRYVLWGKKGNYNINNK